MGQFRHTHALARRGGFGEKSKMHKIQLRPDPLAH